MLKLAIIIAIVVVGYVAYTGIDVTSEYETISKVRTQIFENIVDPLAKKILKQASELDLNVIIDSTISKYGEKNE